MSMPIIPILLQSKLVQRIRTMVSLDFMLFCFMYRLSQKRKRQLNSERRCHSRYRKSFYKQLSEYERRIRRRYIPRPSLHVPLASAWRRLYDAKQDQALITLTGVDFDTFDWLVARFNRYYDSHSPFVDSEYGLIVPMARHKGRPRHCSGTAILGLCLAWTRTRGSCMVLQMIFGMTANSVSMYLRFGRRILIAVLNKEPDARIQVPDAETIRHYQRLVTNRHPILDGVWCTMDGLKLKLQRAPKVDVENNFFNGWKHDHYVGAVIVFVPMGQSPSYVLMFQAVYTIVSLPIGAVFMTSLKMPGKGAVESVQSIPRSQHVGTNTLLDPHKLSLKVTQGGSLPSTWN